jgi:hypothetical protein
LRTETPSSIVPYIVMLPPPGPADEPGPAHAPHNNATQTASKTFDMGILFR